MVIDRFAPSPTGLLHLGHAFSAWTGWHGARAAGGRFLLRMEDLDQSRVRPAYYDAIERDLAWLGLDWDGPVLWQSTRTAAYGDALAALEARGLTYRCRCTRRDVAAAVSAPQDGAGPDGPVYPGLCRQRGHDAEAPHAVRLDMRLAVQALGGAAAVRALGFHDRGEAPGWHPLCPAHLVDGVGDVVLNRRDGAVAYHLAVVVDDAHQGITRVTRGVDLLAATDIHRVLQALLGYPVPEYRHHRLIRDAAGKRLAKRDDARALATLRAEGATPDDVRTLLGLPR